jgi:arginase
MAEQTDEVREDPVATTLIGVPFSSKGLPDGISRGIGALRSAGLAGRLGDVSDLRDDGDLRLGVATPLRAASGLANEPGLVELSERVEQRVAASGDRRPLLVGGDCPVFLGALAAVRAREGGCGLLMVDGHEDAWPPHETPAGEASDSELGIALGLFEGLEGRIAELTGLLDPRDVALLGPRDAAEIGAAGVDSLRGRLALFISDEQLLAEGAEAAIEAALTALAPVERWWLHIDLDVLATGEFPAADYLQPGGLHWDQLERIAGRAWSSPACAGASVVIYNADLDPQRVVAERTVEFAAAAFGAR